jgi:hypothetical protein
MSWIANVSGALAAPWMAGRSGPLNTAPHASSDRGVSVAQPPMCHRGHPRNNDASPVRRSSIIASLRKVVLAWASCCSPQEPKHDHQTHSGSRPIAATPATGWSWTDGRFVREHMDHLSREAVLLYFFLSAVADVNGLSFYGDGTVAARLRMPLPSLLQARDELLAYDLIAHEPPLTQVLSLPQHCQRRRSEPAGGLMQLGDILRRAIASTHTDQERSQS